MPPADVLSGSLRVALLLLVVYACQLQAADMVYPYGLGGQGFWSPVRRSPAPQGSDSNSRTWNALTYNWGKRSPNPSFASPNGWQLSDAFWPAGNGIGMARMRKQSDTNWNSLKGYWG